MTEGGIRMPSVPPAAMEAVERLSAYRNLRISGMATLDMVAAVASDDPQIAANPPQATMVAIASPPRKCPRKALETA